MTGRELLENHPEVAKTVTSWYVDRFLATINDENLPENFKQFAREAGMDADKIAALIDSGPRGLFDFFDEKNMKMGIVVDEQGGFWWTLGTEKSTIGYEHRKNAETAAIVNAFKLMEESYDNNNKV